MFNNKEVTMLPCTVKIIDRRNGSSGEDMCILTNIDFAALNVYDLTSEKDFNAFSDEATEYITDKYNTLGFQVESVVFGKSANITFDALKAAKGVLQYPESGQK